MQLHAIAAAVSWGLGDTHGGFPAAFAQYARTASPAAQWVASAVCDAMWQGAAVAFGLLVCLRFAPRVSAAHRFAAWASGFGVLTVLPFLPFLVHLVPAAHTAVASSAARPSIVDAGRAWFEFDSRWALAIAALWLAASLFRLAEVGFHSLRLRKLWKTAIPIADAATAATLKAALPMRRRVEMCTTDALDRPSVIGFFAPRILIPNWLYARLTPQELMQVVMHEAEHLRRHDDWTNLIQKFSLVLFPLNPALAWIERRLCREREMACDEGVVRLTQKPRAYAACLASLAERGLERDLERRAAALSLAAWRGRPELVHRVHGILGRKPVLSPAAARAVLGVVGCGLIFSSVELARAPQLVGFAAKPQPQQMAQADAVINRQVELNQVAYRPLNAASLAASEHAYHVVRTDTMLPASGSEAAPVRNNRQIGSSSAAVARESDEHQIGQGEIAAKAAGNGTPHMTLLKATMPEAAQTDAEASTAGDVEAPQYIVLTTWTQVEAAPQSSRTIADYDADASAEQSQPAQTTASSGEAKSGGAPGTQIVVTRLLLKIGPPSAAGKPANGSGGSNSDASTSFKSVQQPAVIPFGNGWLIFQL
jgi:beta-lactamase regulating signal transducer with metallopeptidase domain